MDWTVGPQRSLPDAIADRITEAIRVGALRPGERIIESTLAHQLKVSRGPLREALKSLEANHLVETRRNRGTYVAEPSREQLRAMISVRAALEGWAARLVAANADPGVLAELRYQHETIRLEATSGDAERWRDLDWKFHEAVCRLSGNEFLLNAWRQQSNLIRLFLHSHQSFDNDVEGVLANHEGFLKVLSSRNPVMAEKAFRAAILKSGYMGLGLEVPDAFSDIVEPERQPGPRQSSANGGLRRRTSVKSATRR